MSEFDNVPPPPATTDVPADQRTMALDQAKEALNFQITVTIAMVISIILMVVIIGGILAPIVGIINLVFCIIAAVKANNGEAYRYPFTLRLIK
ncbi:MAG: DUF4870 domain-containing protein [Stenotrophomonas maltophilia]|nr:MAG: DUF4870 domain-containing protein [Stenotrophomonas maltophilia]